MKRQAPPPQPLSNYPTACKAPLFFFLAYFFSPLQMALLLLWVEKALCHIFSPLNNPKVALQPPPFPSAWRWPNGSSSSLTVLLPRRRRYFGGNTLLDSAAVFLVGMGGQEKW